MPSLTRIPTPVLKDGGQRTVELVGAFVLQQLAAHRAGETGEGAERVRPLVVGVQGPQGCGKSHLTALLPSWLASSSSSSERPIRCATLSLDDLYLPHHQLQAIASHHPANKLLQGRGQPGTHDLPLALSVLSSLRGINSLAQSGGRGRVQLPVFEKSAFQGQGDRSDQTIPVEGPIDLLIFEGWCLGFHSLPPSSLSALYAAAAADPEGWAASNLDYSPPSFLQHSIESLLEVNEELKTYEGKLWSAVDVMIQVGPGEWVAQDEEGSAAQEGSRQGVDGSEGMLRGRMDYVWEWRLEQEHNMKLRNGGIGMTDEEVRAFIARYMPSYELFLPSLQSASAPWSGRSLKVVVGRGREVIGLQEF